jgi:hypothetical protein
MKYVKISEEEYRELLSAAHYAWALEQGGVDNWLWEPESVHDYINQYNTDHNTRCEYIEDIVDREVELSDFI